MHAHYSQRQRRAHERILYLLINERTYRIQPLVWLSEGPRCAAAFLWVLAQRHSTREQLPLQSSNSARAHSARLSRPRAQSNVYWNLKSFSLRKSGEYRQEEGPLFCWYDTVRWMRDDDCENLLVFRTNFLHLPPTSHVMHVHHTHFTVQARADERIMTFSTRMDHEFSTDASMHHQQQLMHLCCALF